MVKRELNMDYNSTDCYLAEILFSGERGKFNWGEHCHRVANARDLMYAASIT